LVRKDIALFLRDRRALVVSVLTPIVVAAFFGFLFGGTGSGGNPISRMSVGITDLDDTALTKAVIESLTQDESLAMQVLPEDQARQLVKSGKLRAAIVFPGGFETAATGAQVGLGQMPDVKLSTIRRNPWSGPWWRACSRNTSCSGFPGPILSAAASRRPSTSSIPRSPPALDTTHTRIHSPA